MTRSIDVNIVENMTNREEKHTVFALCCLLFIPAINNFINCILQIGLSLHVDLLTPISYIFMAFCSVFFLYKYIFRQKVLLLISFIAVSGSLLSYLIYPEIRPVLYASPVDLVYSPLNILFYFCIPAMGGIVYVKNYDYLLKSMKVWARITVAIGIFTYLFVCLYKDEKLQYMVYSYHMLTSICACFIRHDAKNKADIPLSLFGSVCILACGARGAVVSLLLFFFVLCLSRFKRTMPRRSVISLLVVLLVVFLGVLFAEKIILYIIATFESYGVKSRFLTSLVNGTITEGSGREEIADAIIAAIKHNPFGYGFFGDRYATLKFDAARIFYAHNVFLEVLCDFGIITGPFLLLLFVYRMLKTLYKNRGTSINKVIVILLPFGLFQLLFSSSYLVCSPFFMLLGLFFKKQKYNNYSR